MPVTDWLAALAVSVVGPEEDLSPDVASLGVKETVTSVLFQPLVFAAGVRLPVMVGAVLSRFTVTEPEPVLPTLSVTVVVLVTAVPSVVTESVAGETVFTPEPPVSEPDHVTVTLDLFHPAALGAGVRTPVAVGASLSSVKFAVVVLVAPLQPAELFPFPTVMVAVCSPFPGPAVVLKMNGLEPDVFLAVIAPVTSTHFVFGSVLTVRVSAAPLFA